MKYNKKNKLRHFLKLMHNIPKNAPSCFLKPQLSLWPKYRNK